MLDSFTTFWDAPDGWSRAPLVLPSDAPTVVASGPDPDRVLLLGSGPVAGVGVTSHREALTGALARQLAEHSGRGTTVEAVGRSGLRLDQIPELLADVHVERFDAVVLTAGLMEALARTSRRVWTRTLEVVLENVHIQQPRDGALVVTGMPAPTSTDSVNGWRGRTIDRHAAALNRTSQSVVAARGYAHFAQLAPAAHINGQPTRTCYSSWASQICTVLEPVLSQSTA